MRFLSVLTNYNMHLYISTAVQREQRAAYRSEESTNSHQQTHTITRTTAAYALEYFLTCSYAVSLRVLLEILKEGWVENLLKKVQILLLNISRTFQDSSMYVVGKRLLC